MKVTINNIDIKVPQSWNECTKLQAVRLATLFNTKAPSVITDPEQLHFYKIMAVPILLNKPDSFLNKWSHDARGEFVMELTNLTAITEWLFEPIPNEEDPDGPVNLKLVLNLTDQKLPKLQIGPKTFLYGPASEGYNFTFEEFKALDATFNKYGQTGDVRLLNKLVAIMYRTHKKNTADNRQNEWSGDCRQSMAANFYKPVLDKRIRRVSKLDIRYKYTVLIFYASYRALIVKRFPLIWKGSGNPHPAGWDAIHLHIAGGSILHDDKIGRKPAASVFFQLNTQEYDRQKAELKRLRQRAKV